MVFVVSIDEMDTFLGVNPLYTNNRTNIAVITPYELQAGSVIIKADDVNTITLVSTGDNDGTYGSLRQAIGSGYDLYQREFYSKGWDGPVAAYRWDADGKLLPGVGTDMKIDVSKNYDIINLELLGKTESGWIDYTNHEAIEIYVDTTIADLAEDIKSVFPQEPPALATVATTGDYNDLVNTPTE
jgi:hypothetical protein